MVEILRPQAIGISALLELARMVIPSDHEFCGFEDDDGTFHSYEQLKALEGQENQVDNPQKAISSLEQAIAKMGEPKVSPPRTVKRCFHIGNTFVAIASDDTCWYLRRMDKFSGVDFWERLVDATTPPLPQEDI